MDRAKFITRCFTDDKDKDAASPIIKRTITCEGCRMSYTYNTTEEDAETVRKCNDCRRKSFLKVLESRTPVGTPAVTPAGTPAASPEKAPTTPAPAAKSPYKKASASARSSDAQCFKCQGWYKDDDTFVIHVGECDGKVGIRFRSFGA